jgi:ABC-type uncharacterized transport system substrate-binding protein
MIISRISPIAAALVIFATFPAGAQRNTVPLVGFLTSGSASSLNQRWIAAFLRGLREASYIDGQNVKIEYRTADDQYDRLEGLTTDLVDRRVSVIVAAGGPISAIAAKKVTNTIPIVFTTIADPVKSGLVVSFNRPGGNVTGNAGLTSELDPKRLEVLYELIPTAKAVGVLVNPNRPGVDAQLADLKEAARKNGLELIVQKAGTEKAIEAAFDFFAQARVDALLVTADPLFNFHRDQVVKLANRYTIPAIYQWREFVDAGGLISYGPSITDAYYQTGVYVAQILNGAKPAELPVMQPTRFELAINLKTAEIHNLSVPSSLLARADITVE